MQLFNDDTIQNLSDEAVKEIATAMMVEIGLFFEIRVKTGKEGKQVRKVQTILKQVTLENKPNHVEKAQLVAKGMLKGAWDKADKDAENARELAELAKALEAQEKVQLTPEQAIMQQAAKMAKKLQSA